MGLERLIMTMEQQGCAFEEPKGCDLYIAPWTKVLCLQQCSWDNSFGFPAIRWNMM